MAVMSIRRSGWASLRFSIGPRDWLPASTLQNRLASPSSLMATSMLVGRSESKATGFILPKLQASEPLLVREAVCYKIAQHGQVRNGVELNEPGVQFRDTGILHLAVDQHRAFLAYIGVEAAEPNGKIGLLLHPDAHQPVEDGIAVLEGHIEFLISAVVSAGPAPDFQPRRLQRRTGFI